MSLNTTPARDSASDLLREAGLRQTACRLALLAALVEAAAPIPLAQLEKQVEGFDRVTVYRTLQAFLQAGLVHRTNDSSGYPHYAALISQGLQANHAHFECQRCGRLLCFAWDEQPMVRLPAGFTLEETDLRLRGLCNVCNLG
jgi:Fur family ferric uptake transcriptional regulator